MINYPNGKKSVNKPKNSAKSTHLNKNHANRGRFLEAKISESNDFYREQNLALIYKRPTPIRVVEVDYTRGPKIVNAYFEKQSTTDFNGVISGRYIDIEAKSTLSKTSFPLHNISRHQIEHLRKVIMCGGLAFFIIEFAYYEETYLLDAEFVINWFDNNKKRSIPYPLMKENGHLIRQTLDAPVDYLAAILKFYL